MKAKFELQRATILFVLQKHFTILVNVQYPDAFILFDNDMSVKERIRPGIPGVLLGDSWVTLASANNSR